MNSGVELHDLEVTDVTCVGADVRVVFRPAYVHRSDGTPGSDAGWGYLEPVEFIFRGGSCTEIGDCRGPVADGAVSADDRTYSNLVPLPLEVTGAITAHFEFASGGVLTVSAMRFSCSAIGEPDPNFRERYEG
jgi:hypothetical protein